MNSNTYQNILHIGLPKTATTSLQSNVFPELIKLRPHFNYNDPIIIQDLYLYMRGMLNKDKLDILKSKLSTKNNFISFEYLVNSNPRQWESSAEKIFNLFGNQTTILITVRDSESFMRSIYLQSLHENNIRLPEEFFVNSKDYDLQESFLVPALLQRFDVDSFDLKRLSKIYTNKFLNVFIVPISSPLKLDFLTEIFNLSQNEIFDLQKKFNNKKKINLGYSNAAVKLTLSRSYLLQKLGLEIIGSDSTKLKNTLFNLDSKKRMVSNNVSYRSLSLTNKLLQFIPRVKRRLSIFFNWRFLMQNVFTRYIFKEPYSLPSYIYRNKMLIKSNDEFISELIKNSYRAFD